MYIGTSINESPVIAAQAGQAITNGALLAVAMDADGVKVVSTAGGVAVGLLIPETDNVAAGDTVTVQVKDMGLWKVGAAVTAGDLLTPDATGKATKAAAGNFILAQALEAVDSRPAGTCELSPCRTLTSTRNLAREKGAQNIVIFDKDGERVEQL